MKKIFLNKKKFKHTMLIQDFFICILGAIIWSFWVNLITWSRPQLNAILDTIIIFQIIFIIRTLALIIREHLISIYLDSDNNVLIINQLRVFRKDLQTKLNIERLNIFELKNGWFQYFNLQDDKNFICISSSNYGLSEKKVRKIHKKLHKTISVAQVEE